MARRKKVRVDFKRNRGKRTRPGDLTREVGPGGNTPDDLTAGERLSGKGDLSRRRTVMAEEHDGQLIREVDAAGCVAGTVMTAIGLHCLVAGDDGVRRECTVRRVLRTLARDGRNAVVAGDRVLVRPGQFEGTNAGGEAKETGVVERVEPRDGVLSRGHEGREHVLVANVEQVVVVASADDPPFKPMFVDRVLVSAEKGGVGAVVCINKADLVDRDAFRSVVDLYDSLGYPTVLTSTVTGEGVDRLRELLAGRRSVVGGQSGVGKSSLLNAVEPDFSLRVGEVSGWSRKGTHTTRKSVILPLSAVADGSDAGWVADTPGVRQFALWDVDTWEVEAYFVDFAPFIPHCKYPDCTHTHEDACAVKEAVERGEIARVRYDSYVRLREGIEE